MASRGLVDRHRQPSVRSRLTLYRKPQKASLGLPRKSTFRHYMNCCRLALPEGSCRKLPRSHLAAAPLS
ncbi:hypothetical protein DPMN_072647 [Dreissena polymorpha]|uniref:Uncharacterized protein n=1 Tax=Dreissena polymorpha TaxID=45954 RepID=A0A9D4H9R2_DREPO|nr:hypothetical protein DPMN_072647 [Dreissena polymorpha]